MRPRSQDNTIEPGDFLGRLGWALGRFIIASIITLTAALMLTITAGPLLGYLGFSPPVDLVVVIASGISLFAGISYGLYGETK